MIQRRSSPLSRAASSQRLEPLRHVDAGVLNIAYYEAGPADGPVVMLMHGFPYDIHSYVDVAPLLAAQRLPRHRALFARLRCRPAFATRQRRARASRPRSAPI